jgi:hypothetical protein
MRLVSVRLRSAVGEETVVLATHLMGVLNRCPPRHGNPNCPSIVVGRRHLHDPAMVSCGSRLSMSKPAE